MKAPTIESLPADLKSVARMIARTLERAGKEAWLVGGAVRDLALGRTPWEIDMATDALPDEVEALFEGSLAVGKAFGTIIVRLSGIDVEVTTFRSERGYSDGRRPDEVAYGTSAEEDSRRRDFTCNALFLDPLSDRFLDPQSGLRDLEAKVLRCVGDARARFTEDALRILRLARFSASTGLEPEAETLEAARAVGSGLRGVSAERMLKELTCIFGRIDAHRAIQLLDDCGVLGVVLGRAAGNTLDANDHVRIAILRELPQPVGVERGFAVLLGEAAASLEDRLDALAGLKPSSALVASVKAIWRLADPLARLTGGADVARSERIRCMRDPAFRDALAVARATAVVAGAGELDTIDDLGRERDALGEAELFPEPWITSHDLAQTAIPRGPRWGELLAAAEMLQLDRAFETRESALEWLATQEGGNTPRSQ